MPFRSHSRGAVTLTALGMIILGIVALVIAPELYPEAPFPRRILQGCFVAVIASAMFWLYRDLLRGTFAADPNHLGLLVTEQDWERRIEQLQKREQALADRLATYHGWQEFPSPVDLSDPQSTDEEIAELANKDRQLLKLLSDEAESLFERIQNNVYQKAGQVDPQKMRDDALDLVTRVARIYQPDAEQPLTQTSMDQIMRAASRAFLQLLIVLEQLPLNVQHMSLNDLYVYTRRGLTAYRMYQTAVPFWPYVNTAYYLGRFALGANPLTMAATWAITTASAHGAKAVAGRMVNQNAMLMLHQVIQVIGYEAASIYGGDFRYRDANWIYATELTHLLAGVEVTPKTLAAAMREISALRLRNEYDRNFVLRLLAEQKSARPDRFRAKVVLSQEERQTIQQRLITFARQSVDMPDRKHTTWLKRLDKRLAINPASPADEGN